MFRMILFLVALVPAVTAWAEHAGVLRWDVERNLEPTYRMIYRALEKNNFYVIFEPDIGRNLRGFAATWGEDYNRNDLKGIRSMVVCNPWYTNQLSNLDPDMLAMCPLHLTLYQQDKVTSVVFVRPTFVGADSPAMPLLQEIEEVLTRSIEEGIEMAGMSSVPPPQRNLGNIGHQTQPAQHQDQEGDGSPEQ